MVAVDAPVGDAHVVVVGHQVVDVLLQVGAGAGDAVDLVLADHLGQRQAQLGGAHRACQRDQHFSTVVDELFVGLCCG